MQKRVYKQTGIRLPEETIHLLKRKAARKGVSFNAYVESVLNQDVREEIPYIDPNAPIDPEILALSGRWPAPTQEEIDADPRLQAILGL